MTDSDSRHLSAVFDVQELRLDEPELIGDTELAEVVALHRQRPGGSAVDLERRFFVDTVAEYQWARDAAGLARSTLDQLVKPVIEVCEFFNDVPWRLSPRQLDQYFSGPGKRAPSTVRLKMSRIDGYFAFLEQRYGSEISNRFGVEVESPVDEFNRPVHRGDFGLRVPPSQRAMREFFAQWRESLASARKWSVSCRDYVMARLAYISGVRSAELCAMRITDVHWEVGQWGRIMVHGKGSHGSGPRDRFAYIFEDGRELLWWYLEQIRGEFSDDPDDPRAPLFPSERIPTALSTTGAVTAASPVTPATFRRALHRSSTQFLTGPVSRLYPHLLRHACATHNYERGMGLWEVQRLLGHERATTTVGYLATARADPEQASLASSGRAVQRLMIDPGRLG